MCIRDSLYSSLLKNMNDVKGIPIAPTISQEIGLVWQKGKYLNSRTEQFIALDVYKRQLQYDL